MKDLTDQGLDAGTVPAHGGRREEAARRLGIPKEELLDFSASINLLGPSPAALKAVKNRLAEVAHYPEERSAGLAAQVAGHLGVLRDEVVLGNGSIEIIYWLAAMLKPRRVLIADPTFSEYRLACMAAGAVCDSLLLKAGDDFALDAGHVQPQGYDLVFVCNPNNPTGCLASVDEISYLWSKCRAAGAGLVVDEAFIDFAGKGKSVLSRGSREGLFVIRSFTKSFALAGLRLGCLVAAGEFASRIQLRLPPWNVNVFARAAAEASLADSDYMERTRKTTAVGRKWLCADLNDIDGIEALPSEANFILCRLRSVKSDEVVEQLAMQGILVRDCRSFPGLGNSYIRVAVREERENAQLVAALRCVMEGGASAEAGGRGEA